LLPPRKGKEGRERGREGRMGERTEGKGRKNGRKAASWLLRDGRPGYYPILQ